ncbi:MAG: glutaredoxin family protein [Acidimicrobiales bacterium]
MLNDYRRNIGFSAVVAGLIVVVINYLQGDVVFATILLVLLLFLLSWLLWWTRSNRGGPHISHAAAQAAAGDNDVIVYWRPGCRYCDRLKRGLGSARHDVSWVNISRDPEAAEWVAAHRDGSHSVPTAVTGAGRLIDATPSAIRAQLGAAS